MAGMEDMLKRENVQIIEKVSDWEESVHVAVQPLVDQGYVKSDYIDGIITREQFWVMAKFKYPTHQINFCTEAALDCLTFVGSEVRNA